MAEKTMDFHVLKTTVFDDAYGGKSINVRWTIYGHKGTSVIPISEAVAEDKNVTRAVALWAKDDAEYMWQRDKYKMLFWWPIRDWLKKCIRQVRYG